VKVRVLVARTSVDAAYQTAYAYAYVDVDVNASSSEGVAVLEVGSHLVR
jgi:hypothetical protein